MNAQWAIELLRRGRSLAATLAPQHIGFRAWAGVYPLDVSKPGTEVVLRRLGIAIALVHPEQPAFRIRVIEVSEPLLRLDSCICEDDLRSRADVVVFGEKALMDELERLGVGQDSLEVPFKVDYPI